MSLSKKKRASKRIIDTRSKQKSNNVTNVEKTNAVDKSEAQSNTDLQTVFFYSYLKSWGEAHAIQYAYEHKGGKSNAPGSVREAQIELLQFTIQYFLKNPSKMKIKDNVSTLLGVFKKIKSDLKKGSKLLRVVNDLNKPLAFFAEGYGIKVKPENEILLFLDSHELIPDKYAPLKTLVQDLNELKRAPTPDSKAEDLFFSTCLEQWSKKNYISEAYQHKNYASDAGEARDLIEEIQEARIDFLQSVIDFLHKEKTLSLSDKVGVFMGVLDNVENQLKKHDKDPSLLDVVNEFQSSLNTFVKGNLSGIKKKTQEETLLFLDENGLMPDMNGPLKTLAQDLNELKKAPTPDGKVEELFFSTCLEQWSKKNYILEAYQHKNYASDAGEARDLIEEIQEARIDFLQSVIDFLHKEKTLSLSDKVGAFMGVLDNVENQLKKHDKDPSLLNVVNEFQSSLNAFVKGNLSGIKKKSQEETLLFLDENGLMPDMNGPLKTLAQDLNELKKAPTPDGKVEELFFSTCLEQWSKKNYILDAYRHKNYASDIEQGEARDLIEEIQEARIDFLQSVIDFLHKEKNLSLSDKVGVFMGVLDNIENQLKKHDKDPSLLGVVNEFQLSLNAFVKGNLSGIKKKTQEELDLFLQKNGLRPSVLDIKQVVEKMEDPTSCVGEHQIVDKENRSVFSDFKRTGTDTKIKEKSNGYEHIFLMSPKDNKIPVSHPFIPQAYIQRLQELLPNTWVVNDQRREAVIKNDSEKKEILITATSDNGLCFFSNENSVNDVLYMAKTYVDSIDSKEYDYEYDLCCSTMEQAVKMVSEAKANGFDLKLIKNLTINDQALSPEQIGEFIHRIDIDSKRSINALK